MVKKAKIDYDAENDIFYVYTGEKVKDSLQIENFILDFSFDDKIVGIEILNASKTLSDMLSFPITKEILQNIIDASITTISWKEIALVRLLLFVKPQKSNVPSQLPVPIQIPVGAIRKI